MASVQNHWVEPPDNIGLSNGVVTADSDPTIPVWEWGTTHLLEWTTPWEFFNLFLVQDYKPNDEDTILRTHIQTCSGAAAMPGSYPY